ncbi:MAG: FtsQ-type POTRA domain-containing protein [Candidatus Marinimicrobia bacterium]|jgi:cell division protein FtsQ|nr:FtsQ-type POTRA domain-containing protein [Candidatus Neomarinimicrobiota bacterium]MDP6592604.1 FtsQ-type POTRA domain-containing protein [Candidatus Neomarinimicrobiota bacterium]MDP6836665.1 FtsQ-type POTRA domain-containing protein [Candidatus Neomarinimicrobiota bacterium]|tara:strand:+ start:12570 stop:13382 length:813 start_codon:yes stop_codon:yes gene_type:complete
MRKRQTKNKKRKGRSIKRMPQWVSLLVRATVVTFSLVSVAVLILFAFSWADSFDHFDVLNIRVAGHSHLQREDILESIDLPRFPSLMDIDLEAIQRKLEEHPFVKGARISRDFPSTLNIDLIERSPIAYLNLAPFIMIDADGVVLPTENGSFDFDIPTLTGFNPATELYPIGKQCLSQKVMEAVEYLHLIRTNFTNLYSNISEMKVDAGDEYVIVLAKRPTQIYLGAIEVPHQLNMLRKFAFTVSGIRSLYDYKYVDLRYRNQIIVRERT